MSTVFAISPCSNDTFVVFPSNFTSATSGVRAGEASRSSAFTEDFAMLGVKRALSK